MTDSAHILVVDNYDSFVTTLSTQQRRVYWTVTMAC